MDGSILKITGMTPQLEMEIAALLDEAALVYRRTEHDDLFVTFDVDGKAVGIACAGRYAEHCLIHFVVVRPALRMKGTGRALVNHVLGYFAGRCDRVYVSAGCAGRFFEQFGFTAVSAGELPADILAAEPVAAPGPGAGGTGAIAGDAATKDYMVLELPSRWTVP